MAQSITMRKPVERQVARKGVLGEFDIARVHVVDAAGAAEVGGLGEALGDVGVDQGLDLQLDLVGELVAVAGRTA